MSWWNAILEAGNEVAQEVGHAATSVAHEVEHETQDVLHEVSHDLTAVGDNLQEMDEAIEAVPVLGTLYDLTPVHTAAHLGSEWANVGGELAGDLDGEMSGRHADWGHLGRQALAAGVDTAITVAASEIGGAGAGKLLGKVGGSAGRLGMKTLGKDVAGQLGAGGARSITRRGADLMAHTGVKGVIGGAISAPLNTTAHGAGIGWDNRPHLGRMNGESYPPSSGRLGQGGGVATGNMGMRNVSQQQPTGDMTHMSYIHNDVSNRPVQTNIPHPTYTPLYETSFKEQMTQQKRQNDFRPPVDSRPPPIYTQSMDRTNYNQPQQQPQQQMIKTMN